MVMSHPIKFPRQLPRWGRVWQIVSLPDHYGDVGDTAKSAIGERLQIVQAGPEGCIACAECFATGSEIASFLPDEDEVDQGPFVPGSSVNVDNVLPTVELVSHASFDGWSSKRMQLQPPQLPIDLSTMQRWRTLYLDDDSGLMVSMFIDLHAGSSVGHCEVEFGLEQGKKLPKDFHMVQFTFGKEVKTFAPKKRLYGYSIDEFGSNKLGLSIGDLEAGVRIRYEFKVACQTLDDEEAFEAASLLHGAMRYAHAIPQKWLGNRPIAAPGSEKLSGLNDLMLYRERLIRNDEGLAFDRRPFTPYQEPGQGGSQPNFGSTISLPVASLEAGDVADMFLWALDEELLRPSHLDAPGDPGEAWQASLHPQLRWDDSQPHHRGPDMLGLQEPLPKKSDLGYGIYPSTHEEHGQVANAVALTGSAAGIRCIERWLQGWHASGRLKDRYGLISRAYGRTLKTAAQFQRTLEMVRYESPEPFFRTLDAFCGLALAQNPWRPGEDVQPLSIDTRLTPAGADYVIYAPWEEAMAADGFAQCLAYVAESQFIVDSVELHLVLKLAALVERSARAALAGVFHPAGSSKLDVAYRIYLRPGFIYGDEPEVQSPGGSDWRWWTAPAAREVLLLAEFLNSWIPPDTIWLRDQERLDALKVAVSDLVPRAVMLMNQLSMDPAGSQQNAEYARVGQEIVSPAPVS